MFVAAGRCRCVLLAAGEPERHRPGVLPARCSTEGWSGCPRQDRGVVRDARPRKHSKTAANGQSRSCRGRTTLMIRTATLICAIARSCRGTNRTTNVSAADGGTRRTAPDVPPSGEQRPKLLPGGPPGGPGWHSGRESPMPLTARLEGHGTLGATLNGLDAEALLGGCVPGPAAPALASAVCLCTPRSPRAAGGSDGRRGWANVDVHR